MRLVGEEVDPAGHEQRVSTLPRAPPLLERGAVARDRAWDVGGAPRRGLSCGRRAGAGEARRSTAVGSRGRAVAVAVADPPSLMCCLWCHQTTARLQPQRPPPKAPGMLGLGRQGRGRVTPRQFAGDLRAPSPEAAGPARPCRVTIPASASARLRHAPGPAPQRGRGVGPQTAVPREGALLPHAPAASPVDVGGSGENNLSDMPSEFKCESRSQLIKVELRECNVRRVYCSA